MEKCALGQLLFDKLLFKRVAKRFKKQATVFGKIENNAAYAAVAAAIPPMPFERNAIGFYLCAAQPDSLRKQPDLCECRKRGTPHIPKGMEDADDFACGHPPGPGDHGGEELALTLTAADVVVEFSAAGIGQRLLAVKMADTL